jgi:WD40 repeat protein/cytochrome c553
MIRTIVSSSLLIACSVMPVAAAPDGVALYGEHCAECHQENRLGGTGPALIPETLGRMYGPKLTDVIANGRDATQMPAFAEVLSGEEIAAISDYLAQPLAETPTWTVADIAATREMSAEYTPVIAPAWDADPMNITLVVELGDHHVSVLNGDTFAVLDRFPTPFAVHGGPKFSPDGRYVFVMSRDGWVQKYDIWALKEIGRVRAGLNSRNISMSHDGKWLAVANYLPMTLTILSTEDLTPVLVRDVVSQDGTPSRVSAVYQAPQRESFVLALKDAPEIWELTTAPGEGQALFDLRRIVVGDIMDDFFFTPDYTYLIGANRDGDKGVVVDLDKGREISDLPLPGMPHLGSGITWESGGRRVMATPHLREGVLSVIDLETWQLVKTIETLGPGFFLRSHENSPYVWADVFFGPNRDALHIIDKETLEIVKTLRPEPGKTVAHIEFTRDGSHALVSIWEDDGAVIVFDAATFEEVMRLPMRKPSGKYNVWNKITFSDGTSH